MNPDQISQDWIYLAILFSLVERKGYTAEHIADWFRMKKPAVHRRLSGQIDLTLEETLILLGKINMTMADLTTRVTAFTKHLHDTRKCVVYAPCAEFTTSREWGQGPSEFARDLRLADAERMYNNYLLGIISDH